MDSFVGASGSLAKKQIVLGVTGSIAAYKAALLVRLLLKAGAQVDVVLTESAAHFVGPATFSGLGATVHTSLWTEPGELHVRLAQRADAILIAPASADTLARLAQGRADDLLSATVLASRAPLLLAPSLHPTMWAHPATTENAELLRRRGARIIGPAHGEVASGDVGDGRLEEPERIVAHLELVLGSPGILSGRKLLITAGPTRERIDPVRYLTNDSSGKMGFALAEQAARQGAQVTLVAGPVNQPTPPGVVRIDVETALEMQSAVERVLTPTLDGVDALIMAAAVADYRPAQVHSEKLKRDDETRSLELAPNPDILGIIGKQRSGERPLLVGFALETAHGDALISLGRKKLIDKRVDLVVANEATDSLGKEDNRVLLVSAQDCRKLDTLPKAIVALAILEWVAVRLSLSPLGEFSA